MNPLQVTPIRPPLTPLQEILQLRYPNIFKMKLQRVEKWFLRFGSLFICCAQDRDRWRALVNAELNVLHPEVLSKVVLGYYT